MYFATKQTGYLLILTVLLVFLFSPFHNHAESSSVENTVSVSASSGGNSAESGEIVEGETVTSVFIETIVDGEVVEHIDIKNAEDGVVSSYKDENVEVTTTVELGGDQGQIQSTQISDGDEENESIGDFKQAVLPMESVLEQVTETVETAELPNLNSAAEEVKDKQATRPAILEQKFSFIALFSKFISYVFGIFTI